MNQYGIFIGRFQPLHVGHMAVINEIIADGLTPVVLVGRPLMDAKVEKYPLTFKDTEQQFALINEDIVVDTIYDRSDDSLWLIKALSKIDEIAGVENATLYYTRKPEDVKEGSHYVDMFKPYMRVWEATYPKKLGIMCHSTEIRRDILGNCHFMDGRVFKHVKKHFINTKSA